MSGSDQRLWHKERELVQKATGDKRIESAKDLMKWERATGKKYVTPNEHDRIMRESKPAPDITDDEARGMVDEFREETYGRLPDGESIRELHGDRILVQMQENVVSSILHVPQSAKGRPRRGKVLMVGPGRLSRDGSVIIPMEVKRGDVVVLAEFSGVDVGDDKRLVEEDEVMCIINSR